MKTLYTSYFARNADNPNAIAICGLLTSWVRQGAGFRGEHRPEFGPSWELVQKTKSGQLTHQQFAQQYLVELQQRGLTPQEVVDRLPDGAILLCYEAPEDFCHRHILAEWLQQGADVQVYELLTQNEQRQQQQNQLVDKLIEW